MFRGHIRTYMICSLPLGSQKILRVRDHHTMYMHVWKVVVLRHTCDRVSFFSSSSSRSVFCSLSLILSNSSSILLFSFSVMPGLVSTVTAPTDFIGAAEITIPFIWLECSPCRLERWAITYSWLTNDFVQYGHYKMNWRDSSLHQ